MAVIEIPLDNSVPSFTFSTELDGETFNFEFRWNGRIEVWVFDLLDNERNPVQTGNPLIVEFELLRQNVSTNRPKGRFLVRNHAEVGVDPTRFNLGGDIKLYYVEEGTFDG